MIIPKPNKIEYLNGEPLLLLARNAEKIVASEKVSLDLKEEGYTLLVDSNGAHLTYRDEVARVRAISTLEQLIKCSNGTIMSVRIEDAPKIAMRKYMMDVSRYFFSVEEILKQIDYLALYKFNYLHLHLTDDQGWRVEIKKLPKLTEIGSVRYRTLMRLKKHAGFYTQEDLKKIVSYAHHKGIKVIPEIDMPGHFQSALASYPELGCFHRKVKVAENFGIKFDVACLAKSTTMEYVKIIIDELSEIFTDGYFHIGGDEVPSTRWELCKDCQKKFDELGLNNYAEYQAHFMNEVSSYILDKGITPIMWNESEPTGLIDKRVIWECWDIDFKSQSFLNEIANGRKIIHTKTEPYYLDLPYSINSLKDVYEYEPKVFEDNLVGVSTCLWTELVPSVKVARKKTFPRLIAGAERFWSEDKNYDDFCIRLSAHYKNLLGEFGVKRAPNYKVNPKGVVKLLSRLWWARRMLYWAGLPNLISNAIIAKKYRR